MNTPESEIRSGSSDGHRISLSLFLLSAATLAFEINLTRLFSVAQFYHFAFMIISIALLGFGASGTVLAIFPGLRQGEPRTRLRHFALGAGTSILLAYLLANWLPFDSFSLVWDRRQALLLALHYAVLATPFFFSGLALGFLLAAFPQSAGRTYAVNLVGSALGCVIALLAPPHVGGEGMVTLSSGLAALAAVSTSGGHLSKGWSARLGSAALLVFSVCDLGLRLVTGRGFPFFDLHISPYKGLAYTLLHPGAEVIFRQWNAFSRIDVVRSAGLHSVPGLSYRFLQPLPQMDGLLVDGDDLSSIPPFSHDQEFTSYLPGAVAFQLRPQASVLVLEPRGGLDLLAALALSSGPVTAVEVNPLIVQAAPLYAHQRLLVQVESDRSYLKRAPGNFDVIILSLASSYHPVQSGAYTLAEDYRYTVECFQDILARLAPDGLLVATRWLQDPPSEDLRLFALAVTALETAGADPHQQIVALRGYNTATILLKKSAFTPQELESIRGFAAKLAFDLSYAPGIRAEETNLYNILPQPRYYQAYAGLLDANPRQAFYDAYGYDVRPPTDDHPFFGHYFKWAQAPQVLAQFGRAWLPFGGAGYFVVLALLLLAVLLAGVLVLLPVVLWKRSTVTGQSRTSPFAIRNLIYFTLLGLAFLFVEIPLMQRFILYLGQPAYAVTVVLFSILLFSALGSRWSHRVPLRSALAALALLVLAMPIVLPPVFDRTLGLPLASRLGLTVVILAPLGFLMGIPFPAGVQRLATRRSEASNRLSENEEAARTGVAWVWAVNGAASVISPVLAALLALTLGFSAVLRIGAICYAAALLTAWVLPRPLPAGSLGR